MDAFNYLAVLLSIIIGLGMTHVLSATGRLIRGRAYVRAYWPPLLWAAILIVIYVQVWWSMFGLRFHHDWTFLAFLMVLLQTITLYMMAAMVLPEHVDDDHHVDLREYYERHAPWFFGFFAATLVVSFIKEIVVEGHLLERANLMSHAGLLAIAVVGMVTRRDLVHRLLAVAGAVAIAAYIAMLFTRLR